MIELLVKNDDDDAYGRFDILEFISKNKTFPIKHIVTPRAGGYADLHKSYLDLIAIASPESELFWVLSDDVTIGRKNWDADLLNIAHSRKGFPYIINTCHNVNTREMTIRGAIGNLDTYPVWSRHWFALAGFGFSFATDGWTSLLCRIIELHYDTDKGRYRYFRDMGIMRLDDSLEPENNHVNHIEDIERMVELNLSPNIQSILHIKASALAWGIHD